MARLLLYVPCIFYKNALQWADCTDVQVDPVAMFSCTLVMSSMRVVICLDILSRTNNNLYNLVKTHFNYSELSL